MRHEVKYGKRQAFRIVDDSVKGGQGREPEHMIGDLGAWLWIAAACVVALVVAVLIG